MEVSDWASMEASWRRLGQGEYMCLLRARIGLASADNEPGATCSINPTSGFTRPVLKDIGSQSVLWQVIFDVCRLQSHTYMFTCEVFPLKPALP